MLFFNGGIFYFLYNHLKHFFESVKDKNKLLKAVHSDFQCNVIAASKKKKNIFIHHSLGRTREFSCYYLADFGHVSD